MTSIYGQISYQFLTIRHLHNKVCLLLCLIFLSTCFSSYAQDISYARQLLHKLSGKSFHGRGYVKKGDKKAADFIANEFSKHSLQSFENNYLQPYHFSVNTFPGKIKLKIDGKKLTPGEDFVISSSAPAIDGNFKLLFLPDSVNNADIFLASLEELEVENQFLVVKGNYRRLYGKTIKGVKGVILLTDKTPFWHVSNSGEVNNTVWLKIIKNKLNQKAASIEVSAKNSFISKYPTQNVVAYIEGTKQPERFVVFSAHYDHLGMMGNKTYYPGANDNASGTAMLMDLARHYSRAENQPDYSIAFIAFSGEETGLKGSSYYANHPLFPLDQIELLINLDMVGSGSEGITIVNGSIYPELFRTFERLNAKGDFVKEVKARNESCNSDHCPFFEKGVQSVFIYTRGKEHLYYHVPADKDTEFPFTAYNGLFKLLIAVANQTGNH